MKEAAPRHSYTLRDYLDVEEVSVVRHELIDGEIVAMAGGTPEHAALASAIPALLGAQLLGQPCRTYSADLRLRVQATGLATYADASVVCDNGIIVSVGRSGQVADGSNFKYDINASGSINAADVAAVKARDGLVMP